MQTEVAFLGHIVGQSGLACDPVKISAVRAWHEPGSVKQVRQFIGFVGYCRWFIQNFAELLEPLVVLTRKWAVFAWTPERQEALCGIRWSRCLVYLDDVISFGMDALEALLRVQEMKMMVF